MHYKRFRDFVGQQRACLDTALDAMAEDLDGLDEPGALQFRVLGDRKPVRRALKFKAGRCKVTKEQVADPRLEIVARDDVLVSIFSGAQSPVTAFLQGQMRVRGDVSFGQSILARLASPEGGRDRCPELEEE